jgi:hypothetical protein
MRYIYHMTPILGIIACLRYIYLRHRGVRSILCNQLVPQCLLAKLLVEDLRYIYLKSTQEAERRKACRMIICMKFRRVPPVFANGEDEADIA